MNLRQKCKRLKKENDRLKNKVVQPVFETYKYDIKTIGVSKRISNMDLAFPGVLDFVKSSIARGLGIELIPYIEFDIDDCNSGIEEGTKITAILKIAVRKE